MRSKFNIALFWLAHPAFLLLASFELGWVLAGLIWSWLVFVIGLQIGAHRYFAHSSFKANKVQAGFMNVMALLAGMGTPQDWMIAHVYHHQNSDTDKDPTNWRVIGLWKNYSSLWQLNVPVTQQCVRLVVRSLKSPVANFLHNHYIAILVLWGGALFLISPQAFAWLFLAPVMAGHWGMNLLNHIGHLGGPHGRPTNTSWFFNLVTPGDGYHDYHHQNPGAYRYGQYDLMAWMIDSFLKERTR